MKRLVVNPGRRLSLQKHAHRSEHGPPAGEPRDAPVVVIEVQCSAYLGEDDIVRLDDDFGREAAKG